MLAPMPLLYRCGGYCGGENCCTTTAGDGLVNDQIKATTQPKNVQPKKMQTKAIGIVCRCPRMTAITTGRK